MSYAYIPPQKHSQSYVKFGWPYNGYKFIKSYARDFYNASKFFFFDMHRDPSVKNFSRDEIFFSASKGEPLGREAGHPPPLDATGGGAHAFTTERPGTPGA